MRYEHTRKVVIALVGALAVTSIIAVAGGSMTDGNKSAASKAASNNASNNARKNNHANAGKSGAPSTTVGDGRNGTTTVHTMPGTPAKPNPAPANVTPVAPVRIVTPIVAPVATTHTSWWGLVPTKSPFAGASGTASVNTAPKPVFSTSDYGGVDLVGGQHSSGGHSR